MRIIIYNELISLKISEDLEIQAGNSTITVSYKFSSFRTHIVQQYRYW